jgi:hypothetical protein
METVSFLVSSGTPVTYRTVSNTALCTPNEASKLLSEYLNQNDKTSAKIVYRASQKNGILSFSIRSSDNAASSSSGDGNDNQVHSIQVGDGAKGLLHSDDAAYHHDANRVYKDLTSSGQDDISQMVKLCGPVRCSGFNLRRAPQIMSAPRAPAPALSTSFSKTTKKESKVNKSPFSSTSTSVQSGSKSTSVCSGRKKPSVSLFSNTSAKSKPSNSSSSVKSLGKEEVPEMEVDDNEEWDDGCKIDKEKLKERTGYNEPRGTGGVSEADVLDAMAQDERVVNENEGPTKLHIRGAMDDFIPEDKPTSSKKRKRVVTEKTVMEDGCFVTKYEEEWITDDEAPVVAPSNPKTILKKSALKPTPKPAAKKKGAPAGNSKMMMSFFGTKK